MCVDEIEKTYDCTLTKDDKARKMIELHVTKSNTAKYQKTGAELADLATGFAE